MQADLKRISQYHLFSAINNDVDFKQHTHDYYEIIIVLENNFIHNINGEAYRHAKGDVVILRPMDVHSIQSISELPRKIRDIYVPCRLFEEVCAQLNSDLKKELTNAAPPVFNLTKNELNALHDKLKIVLFAEDTIANQDTLYPSVIRKAIIAELLGIYCRQRLQREKYVPECITKLLNAFQDTQFQALSISEMAYELGYSHNYLCAQFKSCFGTTMQQFLIERRIEKAAAMLLETNDSVEQIGKILGWNKTSSFIKQFKRVYNQTPLQYKKSNN